MAQLVQVVGSLLVLAAFAANQRGRLATTSLPYLLLNLVGSAILAVLAALGHQWGFLLLEATWAAVTAWSLSLDPPILAAPRHRGSPLDADRPRAKGPTLRMLGRSTPTAPTAPRHPR
jgi:hypothetical protein